MNAFAWETLAAPNLLAAARWETQALFWLAVFVALVAVLQLTSRAWLAAAASVVVLVVALGVGLRLSDPLLVAVMCGALGLLLLLPPTSNERRAAGGLFMLVSAGFFVATIVVGQPPPISSDLIEWVVLGFLAAVTVGPAVAMICSRSAVYSAIWFALTLLGTGGLFLYQGAQFLGVATVVVYAGAIVVTFLFVIMLAQPDGNSPYDRISWGWFAKPAAALAGALMLGAVAFTLQNVPAGGLREQVASAVDALNAKARDEADRLPFTGDDIANVTSHTTPSETRLQIRLHHRAEEPSLTPMQEALLAQRLVNESASPPARPPRVLLLPPLKPHEDVRSPRHMANLGGALFSKHLVAVEVAGTLLLAALVGAVAMLSQGPASLAAGADARREGDAHV